MRDEPLIAAAEPAPIRWGTVVQMLTRPYRVTFPMIGLVSLVPLYIFIAAFNRGRTVYAPELAFDRLVPLQPTWAIVYGALYLFLILLPVFVVCREEHIRRTVLAYLTVWISAYVFFLVFPTVAPRPERLVGEGFGTWGLRLLYESDPPFNCFPSIHVAHSFVSALTCYRLHRGLGVVACLCAALVAVSTLFIKQHYVLDVIAGAVLAGIAHVVFLRSYPGDEVPPMERRAAPALALCVVGIVGVGMACFWVAYRLGLEL